jgi:4'-phosphopantetheinyl transferase
MNCTAKNLNSKSFTLLLKRGDQSFEIFGAATSFAEYERLHDWASNFLTRSELDFFKNLSSCARQRSYLMGRFTAKVALGNLLKEPSLHKIGISPGVFGQPGVVYWCEEAPGISISHCDEFAAAIAFPSGHPCGIDVETIRSTQVDVLQSQMSHSELKWAAQAEGSFAQNCTLAWTAKEALSKVLKCGLMSPMEILELSQVLPLGEGLWEAHYCNFPQYKSLCCTNGLAVMSLVMPRKSVAASIPSLGAMLF